MFTISYNCWHLLLTYKCWQWLQERSCTYRYCRKYKCWQWSHTKGTWLVLLLQLGYNIVYNVFDFDTERPEISVFDVTDCYNDSNSLRFRVRFPGTTAAVCADIRPLAFAKVYSASHLIMIDITDKLPHKHLPEINSAVDWAWGSHNQSIAWHKMGLIVY